MEPAPDLITSYLHTPPIQPYRYTTVTKIARENALLRPNKESMILVKFNGSRSCLTNASLYQQAEHLAKWLVAQGVTRGDIVGLAGPTSLQAAVGSLGVMLAGGVVWKINIDTNTTHDIKTQFQLVHAKCLLVDCGENDSFLPSVKAILEHCVVRTQDTDEHTDCKVIFLRKSVALEINGSETLEDIQACPLDQAELPEIYPEDSVIIVPTSGSTGLPKLITRSHFRIINCPPANRPLTTKYHDDSFNGKIFGRAHLTNYPEMIVRGQTYVMLESGEEMSSENAEFAWRVMREEKCLDAWLQPSLIHHLLRLPKHITQGGFRLRTIVTTGLIIDKFYTTAIGPVCQNIMIIYGTSEMLRICFNDRTNDSEPLQTGDVGRPLPGVEIRVVDDRDCPIVTGKVGTIQIRSPYAMAEYIGNPKLTQQVFTERNWYRTGDIGKISPDGNLVIMGREADIITRDSFKIYPGVLESLLKQMPSIQDVCVVSVPDERLLEEVCVCFVSSEHITPEDVKKFFDQNLFKENAEQMPKYFVPFEAFPKVRFGKPNRKKISEDAVVRLGLKDRNTH